MSPACPPVFDAAGRDRPRATGARASCCARRILAPWALTLVLAAVTSAEEPPRVAVTGHVPPASQVDARTAIREGVRWLVRHQNADGSFGSHETKRPYEVLASVPGSQDAFLVATTGLCLLALQDVRDPSAEAQRAREKALDFLLAKADVRRQSGMEHYNVWAFGYALRALSAELSRAPDGPRAAALRAKSAQLVEKLALYQTTDGGWGYLSLNGVPTLHPSDTSMSFTTATILIGVQGAAAAGVEVPAALRAKAVEHLERSRLPDGAFLYGEYLKYRPRLDVNERKGSACRTPACLYALELCGGQVTPDEYRAALEDLLVRHAALQRAGIREPIPHRSFYAISGYFYLYGHAYAGYALARLPAADQARYGPLLERAVLFCREPDGAFWDYPLYGYHDAYGTAYALIALARVPGALGP
ncbi:MAG: hypothetical protein JNK02_11040 [Planctomycetes bacterium]|nr:hypothetical protein [Planctomycetota bacterium]